VQHWVQQLELIGPDIPVLVRVVTGSFDKTVRMWSSDGMLLHRLKGFVSSISGVCYVSRCHVLWTAGGTPDAYLFEPKTGENVCDFFNVVYPAF